MSTVKTGRVQPAISSLATFAESESIPFDEHKNVAAHKGKNKTKREKINTSTSNTEDRKAYKKNRIINSSQTVKKGGKTVNEEVLQQQCKKDEKFKLNAKYSTKKSMQLNEVF